jgi:hypothetical protein
VSQISRPQHPYFAGARNSSGGCIVGFGAWLNAHLRYGLHARQVALATLCTRGSSSFVASTAALIAIGWSEPVPGRVYTPAVDQHLFTGTRLSDITGQTL